MNQHQQLQPVTQHVPVSMESNTPMPTGGRQQQDGGQPQDSEFMRLLDSLEVRVDLMAQMQHTRNQIQARAKAVEEKEQACAGMQQQQPLAVAPDDALVQLPTNRMGVPNLGAVLDAPRGGTPVLLQPQQYVVASASPTAAVTGTTTTVTAAASAWAQQQRQVEDLTADLVQARAELVSERAARQMGAELREVEGTQGTLEKARLSKENEELWDQLREQREIIGRLTGEVEDLRNHFQSTGSQLGCPGCNMEEMRFRLQEVLGSARANEDEVRRLQAKLRHEQEWRDQATQEWAAERESLQNELRELRAAASSPKRLSGFGAGIALMETARVLPALDLEEQPLTAPFSRQMCGVNVTLSEDGYVATRTRGCRQSVLIGSEPLARQALGYYFEVEIEETVEGWVGGLGVGVTRTSAGQLRRVPDKAWRMPNTFIVGYWGCVFLDGKERRTRWRADTVPAGSRVGILVSGDGSGDLRVFVDGSLAVAVEGALVDHMSPSVELFPVVDVFAATLAVALQPRSTPPLPPWGTGAATLSPPNSPGASLASLPRSYCSSTR
jgi:hypothetical protein